MAKKVAWSILGTLRADAAPLSLLVADFAVAAAWKGGRVGNDGRVTIGALSGVHVTIGSRSGGATLIVGPITRYGTVRLVDVSGPLGDKRRDRMIAQRVAEWPVWTMPKTVGKFIVPTSIVAVMLPGRDGTFADRDHTRAMKGAAVVDKAGERALLPMKIGPGIYEVVRYPCRPVKGRGPYTDDVGEFGDVIEISYTDRLPSKYAGLVP